MTQWKDTPEAQRIFRQGWDAAIEAAADRAAQTLGVLSSIVLAIRRLRSPRDLGEDARK